MRTEDVLAPQPVKEIVTCAPETPVQKAAQAMKERKFGSVVVVNPTGHPIGIATESDFVRKIIAAHLPHNTSVAEIMSQPVYTIREQATVAQIVLAMTRHQINHLVVTADGSPDSPATGIISEHDVLLMHGNHPAVLVKRMAKAENVSQLARIRDRADELVHNYLRQQISVPFVGQIISEVNDILIQRALELSLTELEQQGWPRPPEAFCWLALGSEGRQEQMLRTDQDSAIIYADPPPERQIETQAFFHELGSRVVEILTRCGFSKCKGEIMASNLEWVQPQSGWQDYFSTWIHSPEPNALRKLSIFFDFRPVWGDASLSEALSAHIFQALDGQQRFLHLFVESALQHPPPQGFLGNFLVEKSGENKDLFNIKARGLRPLDHAARVLSLAHRIRAQNTFERYAQLAERLPDTELFQEAAMAYEILMRYRALNGFEAGNDGSYLRIQELNGIEKQTLKTCFKTVEHMQQYLQTVFAVRRR